MNCEFDICRYNEKGECELGEVAINSLGMCDSCIIISLDEDFLEGEKKRQREDFER